MDTFKIKLDGSPFEVGETISTGDSVLEVLKKYDDRNWLKRLLHYLTFKSFYKPKWVVECKFLTDSNRFEAPEKPSLSYWTPLSEIITKKGFTYKVGEGGVKEIRFLGRVMKNGYRVYISKEVNFGGQVGNLSITPIAVTFKT